MQKSCPTSWPHHMRGRKKLRVFKLFYKHFPKTMSNFAKFHQLPHLAEGIFSPPQMSGENSSDWKTIFCSVTYAHFKSKQPKNISLSQNTYCTGGSKAELDIFLICIIVSHGLTQQLIVALALIGPDWMDHLLFLTLEILSSHALKSFSIWPISS